MTLPNLYLPPNTNYVDEERETQRLREAASALYGVPVDDLPAADVTDDGSGNRVVSIPRPREADE